LPDLREKALSCSTADGNFKVVRGRRSDNPPFLIDDYGKSQLFVDIYAMNTTFLIKI
jgi:hypothetical protein